jgi:N-acetylmuramoyl-L-alanine amidase
MLKVWLDAGHGQDNKVMGKYDPGAVGNGHQEADIALILALSGRWILNMQPGIEVFMTRDDDSDSSWVGNRALKAAEAGCDFGISLHMNANNSKKVTGTESFYRDKGDKAWSESLQNAALKAFGLRDRGVKNESMSQHPNLKVLDFKPPMTLIEAGFISNPNDLVRVLERDRRVEFWQSVGKILKDG